MTLVHCSCRQTNFHSGAFVLMSLRANEMTEIAREQKGLTTRPAAQLVEEGKVERALAMCAYTARRCSERVTAPMAGTLAIMT